MPIGDDPTWACAVENPFTWGEQNAWNFWTICDNVQEHHMGRVYITSVEARDVLEQLHYRMFVDRQRADTIVPIWGCIVSEPLQARRRCTRIKRRDGVLAHVMFRDCWGCHSR